VKRDGRERKGDRHIFLCDDDDDPPTDRPLFCQRKEARNGGREREGEEGVPVDLGERRRMSAGSCLCPCEAEGWREGGRVNER